MSRSIRKSLGVTRPSLTPEQIKRAREARAEGVTWADLASRFGIAAISIKRALEAAE